MPTEFPSYEPKDFPPIMRAFLAALSVQPNPSKAARAAAMAMLPSDAAKEARIGEYQEAWLKDKSADNLTALHAAEKSKRRIDRQTQAIRRQHACRMAVAEYREAYEAAHTLGVESMEDYATEIAMDGWMEPVYQSCNLVGFKRKFSVAALFKRLAKEMPEEYGTKDTKVSGDLRVGITSLTDEELDRLARGYLERTTNRAGDPPPEATLQPAPDLLPGDGTAP